MDTGRNVVVITGATAGIGRATAQAFARRGWRVALLAREAGALAETRAEREALGAEAIAESVDVADHAAVSAAAGRIEAAWGRIDAWINNEMATVFAPITKIAPEEYARVTEGTYLGAVYGTLAARRAREPRGVGTIVQVGSALAYRAIPLQAPYCAAKFALRGFTDSLRTELLHEKSKVRVTMLQLPAVNTPQFDWCRTHMPYAPRPVGPVFQPELVARTVVWASRRSRREVAIGWPALKAIWGAKLLPSVADWYLARIGYEAQMAEEAVTAERPDNLWHPVPGDAGAHGRFDAEARPDSTQLWLNRHRAGIGITLLGIAVALAANRIRSRRLPIPIED